MSICFPLFPRIRTLLDGSWHFAFVPISEVAESPRKDARAIRRMLLCLQINRAAQSGSRPCISPTNLASFEFTDKLVSIGKRVDALPILLTAMDFADVAVPIDVGVGSPTTRLTSHEFTDVFVSIAKRVGALPVHCAIVHFTDIF